jgi:hypothetical protein
MILEEVNLHVHVNQGIKDQVMLLYRALVSEILIKDDYCNHLQKEMYSRTNERSPKFREW